MSCQSRGPTDANTIFVGVESYPEQMDPRFGTDALSAKIKNLIFAGLLTIDENQKLVPSLAISVTSQDGRVYDVDLRPDVHFQNGKVLTSADVRATFESLKDPTLGSEYRAEASLIDSIETPTPTKIIFKLRQPHLSFSLLLKTGILPSEQALAYREGHEIAVDDFIGAGPYRLDRGGVTRGLLRLKRFDDCFAGHAATLNLVFRTIEDPTLRAFELLKGRLDLVQNSVPPALVPKLTQSPDLNFAATVGNNVNTLMFNFRRLTLRDRRVREAIAKAIDVDGILKYKLVGLANRADSLLNPKHWAYRAGMGSYTYDPQAAKRLLDAAGFLDPDGDGPQTRFTLTYKTSTDKQRLEIVQVIATNLRAVGIGVDIRTLEFGTLLNDLNRGDFDVATLTRVGISDPDVYYGAAHSSQVPPVGKNRGAYANAHLDALLDASRIETDPEKRRALFGDIQKIFFDDLVTVPLWYDATFAFTNKRLSGYVVRTDSAFVGLIKTEKQ